jgi:CBS domain containing-hemolysin-like protein
VKIDNLLRLLQTNQSQIAVVLDEYGGTLGIVTMEDILEQLVGDIWDEHDEVEEDVRQLEDNVYLVSGSVTLDDFCEALDLDEIDSSCNSLGGWVQELVGDLPEEGVRCTYENLILVVSELEKQTVKSVTVTVMPKEDEEEDDASGL